MKSVQEMTFKEASVELENIVRALESGELELEESLARYTRGVELLQALRERLSDAEQKVEVLLQDTQTKVVDTVSAPATNFGVGE